MPPKATSKREPRSAGRRGLALVLLIGCLCGWAAAALAGSDANPWSKFTEPAAGAARSIGDYSGGCVQGAQALPLDGDGYQVMHPSRLRYFGHPSLVDFVRTLGRKVKEQGVGPLLIGDLGQPRGGRATGGHASHQTGLDVDIWFWHPPKAKRGPLSALDREKLKARSILNGKTASIRERWAVPVAAALRLTAQDERVERVFVHPIIKRELCNKEQGERAWLRKIRPWYGHDDHFHVRLRCPSDSPDCTVQDPTPAGDGCAELDWWFDEKAQADRRKARRRYQAKVVSGPKWPAACEALLK